MSISQRIVAKATTPVMLSLFGSEGNEVGIFAFFGAIAEVVKDGDFNGRDYPHVVLAAQEAFDLLAKRIDIPWASERFEENVIDPIFRKYLIPQAVRFAFYQLHIPIED